MDRAVLFRDYDGKEYTVDTPLTSSIDITEVKNKLKLPPFVDSSSLLMERTLVTIWAATNVHRLHEIHPGIFSKRLCNDPIPLLLFGGAAIRMHSSSSNDHASPFFRKLNDVDFILPKKRAKELLRLLVKLGQIYGTRYQYFLAGSDERFNAIRGGQRYRIRTIDTIREDGTLVSGVLDIITDEIDFRHKVNVKEDFNDPSSNTYTTSVENILLSKCQFIFDVRKELLSHVVEDIKYRVLNYPFIKGDRVLLGMEEKDIKDVCAILADIPIDAASGSLSIEKLNHVLKHDSKLALTFRLNMQNIIEKSDLLSSWGIGRSTMARILDRVDIILKGTPLVEKRWKDPWWNQDVETPQVLGKDGA